MGKAPMLPKRRKTHTTHIIAILDRSGSMLNCKEATIAGFDDFIRNQREINEGNVLVTTVLFDDTYEVLFSKMPLEEVPSIRSLYRPNGWTALYDAIGRTINEHSIPTRRKIDRVLCLIMTDGLENYSEVYSKYSIKKLIKEKNEDNWEFIFLGANIDAEATADNIGIKRIHAATYNTEKTSNVWKAVTKSANFYRTADTDTLSAIKMGSLSMIDDEDRISIK
jgi:hypothetical protein